MEGFLWPPPIDEQARQLQLLQQAELANLQQQAAAQLEVAAAVDAQLYGDQLLQQAQGIINDPLIQEEDQAGPQEVAAPIEAPYNTMNHLGVLPALDEQQLLQLQQGLNMAQNPVEYQAAAGTLQQPIEADFGPMNLAVAEPNDAQGILPITGNFGIGPFDVQPQQFDFNFPLTPPDYQMELQQQLVVPIDGMAAAAAEPFDVQLQQQLLALNTPQVSPGYPAALMGEPIDAQFQQQLIDINQNSPGYQAEAQPIMAPMDAQFDALNLAAVGSPYADQLQQPVEINLLQQQQIIVPMEAPFDAANMPALSPAAYEAQKLLRINAENINKPLITCVSPEVQKELEPYGASFPTLSSTLIKDLGRPIAMRLIADMMEELQMPQQLQHLVNMLQLPAIRGGPNPIEFYNLAAAGAAEPPPELRDFNPLELLGLLPPFGNAVVPEFDVAGPAAQPEEELQPLVYDAAFMPAQPLFIPADAAAAAAVDALEEEPQQPEQAMPAEHPRQVLVQEVPHDQDSLREFIQRREASPDPEHPADRLIKEGIIKISKLQLQRLEIQERMLQRQRHRDRQARLQQQRQRREQEEQQMQQQLLQNDAQWML
ncbi:hypothetical protein PMAYCL1PPCAC_03975 [Pristionchus mayeri]|uniref:Uncharacterized protein n=1 Tax=Pristionchus mayeri TaxID=1317129 RepID=A0AAN4ZB58_9BILA|nr:hypothetical protein PMAYCL1PPCAC_03975 [Pristionchus mayeri]